MPTDLPEPRKPSKAAVMIGEAVGKLIEYVVITVAWLLVTAGVAYGVMVSLAMMHHSEPAVPPFGFFFIWGAINGSALLAAYAGSLVKNVMKEDE